MNLKSTEALKEDSKILYSLMLIIIFVSMGQSVYWQTMPIIGREFGFSEMEINTVVSISAAMFIIFTPFWGRLSDRIGRKSVLLCLLYTSPSPRDGLLSRMPSSA